MLDSIKSNFDDAGLKTCKVYYELGGITPTPLYAVVKQKNNFILRVTPYKELAEKWHNERTYITTVGITKVVVLD